MHFITAIHHISMDISIVIHLNVIQKKTETLMKIINPPEKVTSSSVMIET